MDRFENHVLLDFAFTNKKTNTQKSNPGKDNILSGYFIEKRVRRAAPAAQPRFAGEPKAKPCASLPRSETNRQFLPASRFILNITLFLHPVITEGCFSTSKIECKALVQSSCARAPVQKLVCKVRVHAKPVSKARVQTSCAKARVQSSCDELVYKACVRKLVCKPRVRSSCAKLVYKERSLPLVLDPRARVEN